jgi:hypothetical protein
MKQKPFTRRGMLSMTSSIYDPLGLVAPFVLFAKKILQDLCREEHLAWDDPVPEQYLIRWNDWLSELPQLEHVHMRRCITPDIYGEVISCQLHVFADASSVGYGSVAYLRLMDAQGRIHCTFMMGKARLAPLKHTTIPRLELTAAVVAVRIGCLLQQELDIKLDHIAYHTDSTTVLHYIFNKKKRFPIFIANRVQFIHDHSHTSQWSYVNTKDNPADYASRGMNTTKIIDNKYWLQGPKFLWQAEESWPEQPTLSNDYDTDEDRSITSAATQANTSVDTVMRLIEHYSSWYSLKKAVAVYIKVGEILHERILKQNSAQQSIKHSISISDIEKAEHALLRFIQAQYFQREIKLLQVTGSSEDRTWGRVPRDSSLYKLDPFLSDGILRVGGRLTRASIPDAMKYPILLPYKCHLTSLIIRSIHMKLAHAGRVHVLAQLREMYWVIHANSAVRQVISRCVTCRRLRNPVMEQKMADLPTERTSDGPPFTYTGVDFFGPFMIKQGRKQLKRYGAIFTCLSSRAIHIESAASLDTDSFILALRRFLARRGPIRQLRCDNGTNFVGAERQLREAFAEMKEDKIKEILMKQSIEWVFNPPAASHFGGIWERQIRTVRKVLSSLSREFGDKLDEESFRTLMCEVESIVNSRPITTVSSDPNDIDALTPSHILIMKSSIVLPPPGIFQQADVYLRRRWRRVQYLANIFWTRWKREYLLTLQERQKWNQPHRNIHEGDIVLMKDDSLPRNMWSMARVITTEPDRKGFVRSATVKTSISKFRRPVDRLVLLLPVEEQNVKA